MNFRISAFPISRHARWVTSGSFPAGIKSHSLTVALNNVLDVKLNAQPQTRGTTPAAGNFHFKILVGVARREAFSFLHCGTTAGSIFLLPTVFEYGVHNSNDWIDMIGGVGGAFRRRGRSHGRAVSW